MFVASKGDLCFAFGAFVVSVWSWRLFWSSSRRLNNVDCVITSSRFRRYFATFHYYVRNDRSLDFCSAFPDNVLADNSAIEAAIDDLATSESTVDDLPTAETAIDDLAATEAAVDDLATADDLTATDDLAAANNLTTASAATAA